MSEIIQEGGNMYFMYNNRKYLVHVGKRGGRYIMVKGKKHYICVRM